MFGKYLNKFWQASASTKFFLLEASFFLTFAQFAIRITPYFWWSKLLGPAKSAKEQSFSMEESEPVQTIGWAVRAMAVVGAGRLRRPE